MAESEFVWFQEEFPWLGRGFIPAISEVAVEGFVASLEQLGFTVASLSSPPGSRLAMDLHRALGMDGQAQSDVNWDALHDTFRYLEVPPRFALVWRHADEFAARETKVFAEAVTVLSREFEDMSRSGTQAVLILTGFSSSFGSPDRPVGCRPSLQADPGPTAP
jgi:hypothetical protein